MPIAPATSLMNPQGLAIRYQASSEPQLIEVAVKLKRKSVDSMVRSTMNDLLDAIELGAAGGAEFAPTASRAKLVKGVLDPEKPGNSGPGFAWTLEVAGVSPLFLRVMVDALANSGGTDVYLDSLVISGSLPPNGDALSVDERKMAQWLEDFSAFPAAFSKIDFPVTHVSTPRGATVRIALRNDVTPKLASALQNLLGIWSLAKATFPNAAHKKLMIGLSDPAPKIAKKKLEFQAKWTMFDHDPGPPFALLTNMLAKFHATVSPIVGVEYGHP